MSFTRTKYGNHRCKIDGITFDSKREARDYLLLKNRLASKKIEHLCRQVTLRLGDKKGAGTSYRADFVFFDKVRNCWIIWDSKGMETKEYQVKRAWLLDKFCGFIFIENKEKGEWEYIPYGKIPLKFGDILEGKSE